MMDRSLSALCGIASLALLWGGAASAQTTLKDAMAQAYQSNPTLLADREGLKVLDEDVSSARSAGRPSLIGEASVTRSDIDVSGTGGIVGLRLTQPLFRGFRVRNNIRAADANVDAGRESLIQSEIDIFAGVTEAYSAVLRDREILTLNTAMIDILQTIRNGEQRRLDLGERTKTDVSQADARLAGILATIASSDQRLAEVRARYRSLVGQEADNLASLPPLPALPPSRDDAILIAWKNSPRVRQAEHAAKAAGFQVKVAKGAILPSLDASAAVNHRDEIVQILNRKINQDLATFQLVLTVPLYQGGAEYAAVRRAKHVRELRQREIEEATREVSADVSVAWDRLVAARKAQAAYLDVIKANEVAVAGVRREALVGSRTTLEVLDAERELKDARIEYVNAQHREYVANFGVLAVTGMATAKDLGLAVETYDPKAHYDDVENRWADFSP